MSAQHTPRPLEVDGSYGAQVLVFASESDPDDAAGLAINVGGRNCEADSTELVRRWNSHEVLLTELASLINACESYGLFITSSARAAIAKATGSAS